MSRLNQIDQFNKIEGVDRLPEITEDGKFIKWDNSLGLFVYEALVLGEQNIQSDWNENNTESDAYIKNKPTIPDSLDDLSGTSDDIAEGAANLFLTSSERVKLENIQDGAEVNVQSDWNQISNTADDYIKNKPAIPDSLDDLTGTLDNIDAGITNVHLTTTLRTNLNLNTAARHSHSNKNILDNITDSGSGAIITAAERQAIVDMVSGNPEVIRDTVASFIQDGVGISWIHDDNNDTLTPKVELTPFTTDDLAEGTTNLYARNIKVKPFQDILLPANSTVAGRIAGAVAGVDYPSGWVLSVGESEYDIIITHNWDRFIYGINIFSIDTLGKERVLVPFNSAYSGYVANNSNSILIESLTEKLTPIRIVIGFIPV